MVLARANLDAGVRIDFLILIGFGLSSRWHDALIFRLLFLAVGFGKVLMKLRCKIRWLELVLVLL
jgi:hypothetical protein